MRTILVLAAAALAATLAPVRTEAPPQDALRIVGTAQGEEGDAFAFSAAHRPPAGAVVTYFWEFGDGTPGMSGPHMSAVSHRFMQDGTYTVTVRTAGGGGAGTASFEVTVEAKAPVIEALSLQGLAVPGTPTLFQAAASDPGDDPLVYTWDFSDGTPPRSGEDLVELEHVYARGGHYTVALTVTDEDGLEARQTLDVVANPGFLGALTGEVDLPVVGESGKAALYNALPGQRAFQQTPLFTGAAPMHAGVADLRDAAGICLVSGGFWDDEHRVHVNFSWTPAADSVFIPKTYPINWRQRQGSDRLESGQMMVNAMVLGIEPSYEDTKKGAETMAVVQPGMRGLLSNATELLAAMLAGRGGPGNPGRNWQLTSVMQPSGSVTITSVNARRISGHMDVGLQGVWLSVNPGGSGRVRSVRLTGAFAWELDDVARANLLRCGGLAFGIDTHTPWVEDANVSRRVPRISVTFTHPYRVSSVNERTLRVVARTRAGEEIPVAGRIVHDRDGLTVHFVPDEPLEPLAYYFVQLTGGQGGIVSETDEVLPESYEWRFATEPELTNRAGGGIRTGYVPALSPPFAAGVGGPVVTPALPGAAELQASADRCDRKSRQPEAFSIDVVVYQTSCNAPLVPGKLALVRVYTGWGSTHVKASGITGPGTFEGSLLVKVGSETIADLKATTFVNAADADLSRDEKAGNSKNFYWTPAPGQTLVTAEIVPEKPLLPSGEDPQPGSRALSFMKRRVEIRAEVVFALIGALGPEGQTPGWRDGLAGGELKELKEKVLKDMRFAAQNLPVVRVMPSKWVPMKLDPPDIIEGKCETDQGSIPCHQYDVWGPSNVETKRWVGQEVMDRATDPKHSLTIVVIPPGVSHPDMNGLTTRASSETELHPRDRYPRSAIVIAADAPGHTLAHELGHYLGIGAIVHEDGRTATRRDFAQGIEGFRVVPGKPTLNKSALEGNGEARGLYSLMYSYVQGHDETNRFIMNHHYDDIIELVESRGTNSNVIEVAAARPAPAGLPGSAGLPAWLGAGLSGGPLLGGHAQASMAPRPRGPASPAIRVSGVANEEGTRAVLNAISLVDAASGGSSGPGPYQVEVIGGDGRVIGHLAGVGPAPADPVEAAHGSVVDPSTGAFAAVIPVTGAPAGVRIIGAGGEVLAERQASANPPSVEWLEPRNGGTWTPGTPLRWQGRDADGDDLTYTVLYSPAGEGDWTVLAASVRSDGLTGRQVDLRPGPAPTLLVRVSDGFHSADHRIRLRVSRPPVPFATGPDPDGADGVVRAYFDTDLDPRSLRNRFRLDGPGGAVAGTAEYDPDLDELRYETEEPLRPGTTYTARLEAGISDLYGNRLREGYSWTFTTPPDTTPPEVLVTWPSAGGLSIPVASAVRVRFTEAMDERSLARGGLALLDQDGRPVRASVRWNAERDEAVLEPERPLEPGRTYTGVASTSAADLSGNGLAAEARWTFTTAGRLAPRRPPAGRDR